MIDWSRCADVESVPGRCSGAWVVKDSRVIVETCILGNAEDCTPEEIADLFEVPVDVVRRILRHAYQSEVTAIIGPAKPPWPPMTAESQARLNTLTRRLVELRRALVRTGERRINHMWTALACEGVEFSFGEIVRCSHMSGPLVRYI